MLMWPGPGEVGLWHGGWGLGTLNQPGCHSPLAVRQEMLGKGPPAPLSLPRQTELVSTPLRDRHTATAPAGQEPEQTHRCDRGQGLSSAFCGLNAVQNRDIPCEVLKRRSLFMASLNHLHQNHVGNLVKMQSPGLHPRLAKSEPLGLGPGNQAGRPP